MHVRMILDNDFNAVEDLLIDSFATADEARLVEMLRGRGDLALELVAEENGKLVGHLAFSRLVAPTGWLALAPLAVLPKYQRQGVGADLIANGIVAAENAGWRAIVVLGDPKYYRKFGFDTELARELQSPYPLAFTGVRILQDREPVAGKVLEYAPAFEELAV